MLTDAVAMATQEAELNELRATIELLRQQGHAQLSPLHRSSLTGSTPHKDVPSKGLLSCRYRFLTANYYVIFCRICVYSVVRYFVLISAIPSSFADVHLYSFL